MRKSHPFYFYLIEAVSLCKSLSELGVILYILCGEFLPLRALRNAAEGAESNQTFVTFFGRNTLLSSYRLKRLVLLRPPRV